MRYRDPFEWETGDAAGTLPSPLSQEPEDRGGSADGAPVASMPGDDQALEPASGGAVADAEPGDAAAPEPPLWSTADDHVLHLPRRTVERVVVKVPWLGGPWRPGTRPVAPGPRRRAIQTIGQMIRRAKRAGTQHTRIGRLPVFRARAAGRNFRILARPRAGLRHEILSIDQEFGGLEHDLPARGGNGCKQKWEQFLKTMPQDVKDALRRRNQEDAATAFAIHHGVRDLNALTRLRFFSKHGTARGYCPLKTNDPTDKNLWETEKNAARSLLARPSPPLAQKGGIKCTQQANKKDVNRPDKPPRNITGRYRYRDLTGRPGYTVQINQAGRHIEAIRVPVRDLSHQHGRTVRRLQGDLQTDGSFTFYDWKRPDFFGYFRYKDDNHLHVEQVDKDGQPFDHKLVRMSSAPTLLEMAFQGRGFPRNGLVHRSEWYPLTQMQIEHLKKTLKAQNVAKFLQAHFSAPARSRALDPDPQAAITVKFEQALEKVFNDPLRGVHIEDALLARFYARTILTNNKWTFNRITRSQIDWIQIMVDLFANSRKFVGSSAASAKLPTIERYLGLQASTKDPKPGEMPHKYKVTLKLTGVTAIVFSGYRGTITIEKTSAPKWTVGKVQFNVGLSGLAVAAKVSIGDETEGVGESYIEWRPADFVGDLRVVIGSLSAGVSGKAGFMHIFGKEYLPPMHVTFAGIEIAKPDVGIGLEGLFGQIHDRVLPPDEATQTIVDANYNIAYGLQDDVHFCLGSALLTADARQALRILCANELPAFMSSTSRLRIVGHTDPVNTDAFNLTLSKLRAQNTLLALQDILGTNFGIKNVTVTGEGEALARKDMRPPDKPDPRYRRVDVILNSRLVLRLSAS